MNSLGPEGTKVIVLGLDGTRLETLQYLSQQGALPHLARVFSEGAFGWLRSVLPPYSAPAWVSMATGVNPGKHGVFDFYRRDPRTGEEIPINSTGIAAKTAWQILSDRGHQVSVINVPITYPPQPVNGVVISDFLVTPTGRNDYAYPVQVGEEIRQMVPDFHPAPFRTPSRSLAFLERVIEWTNKAEGVCELIQEKGPWSFFMNVFQATDIVQHYFYDYLQPERLADSDDPIVATLLRLYARLDEIIGARMRRMDGRTTLALVSDHGFTALKRAFYPNRWLQDRGWLVMRPSKVHQRILSRLGLSQRALTRWVRRLDVLRVLDRLPQDTRHELGARLDHAVGGEIDWARTRAYTGAVSSQGIYVNPTVRGRQGDLQGTEDELADLLGGLGGVRDPLTGDQILRGVYRRQELYAGPHLDRAPHVLLDLAPGYMMDNKVSVGSMVEDVPLAVGTGLHQPDGFFALLGPSIQPTGEPLHAQITDIAPTILYLLGEAIPSSMDGQVVETALKPGVVVERPIQYTPTSHLLGDQWEDVYSDEDRDVIYTRLKDLGYLG